MAVARTRKKSGHGSLVELVTIVAVALGLALGIQAFLIKPFRIPSESMVPTLAVSQRVLVDRVTYRFSEPDRGDIVVFKPPAGANNDACGTEAYDAERQSCPRPTDRKSDTNFIKRVVAVGGDRLKVVGGRVFINGKRQDEPYVRADDQCAICNLPGEIRIPKDHFFMMGDNRGESADSREWGPIPERWIIGKAFVTYWPPGKIGTL
jgi:signal peptidase I